MNDVKSLQILEARVAKLERAARRWMAGFFAVCVLAVGMGAKFAVMDAEFKIVKAERFEVIGPSGETLAQLGGKRMENGEYDGVLAVIGNNKKKVTTIVAGDSKVYSLDDSDK